MNRPCVISFRRILIGVTGLMLSVPGSLFAEAAGPVERAKAFIADFEKNVRPLDIAAAQADWAAQASGKDEDYKACEAAINRVDAAYSDPAVFARLKAVREELAKADPKPDPILARQIELLYLAYSAKQLDPELLNQMAAKSTAITQAFNVYRAEVKGEKLADSAVRKVLRESKDSAYRKAVWEASKNVGAVVEKDLKELVRLRNEAARKLGYHDFYEMELFLEELDKKQVLRLFDELYELTREPFTRMKGEMDERLAKEYGIGVKDLRPWHYNDPFFQEPPATYTDELDPIYTGSDVVKLCSVFYDGIGLSADDVIAQSDLYERPGKYPHAMCNDMDREGDIRIMANVVPNHQWAATMLHELGHAVYDKYIPRSVPYVLRVPSHTFTTEAVAMFFERLAGQPGWMQALGLSVSDPGAIARVGERMNRDHILVFAGWSQVMVRFESSMYENPDQDLNKLWWDLAEKYQLMHRPDGRNAPDYAAKIHIVSSPAYYHCYIMGQMFASQLHRAVARQVLASDEAAPLYNGKREIGRFLIEKVFAPGASVRWDRLVRDAVGEDLSPKAMMDEVVAAH